ncbi:hypothetical protein GOQ29_04045 [Clostridium sp. D2Q-14]|uniref:hypothetical protein n=1 Tax=Anaeromonas gelatinilytica TaxID=2683194 RepID=UPI00193BAA8F|nr:hypothetical protein [Anaeromonas gelatinilytica]MBS4534784.1 hypothetical protein [Anaeromonas gelatinilytica]
MEDNKREMLEYQINSYIEYILRNLDNSNNLDYFNIKISNHNGNIQAECTLKDRKKAY